MINHTNRLDELITYLRHMRLPIMADQLLTLSQDPNIESKTTLDILEEMITEEYQSRRLNTIARNLKSAQLSQPNANLDNMNYAPERRINRLLIDQLKTCQFIRNHHHVIIQGATGTGKSYIANALCRHVITQGYTALYTRMIELLAEINDSDSEGRLDKLFKKLAKVDLLVIDDFLLTTTTEFEQKYLMEVFEIRSRGKALVLSSQMNDVEWHKKLGGGAIAEAIIDRVSNNSHRIIISGESLRLGNGPE